ncbi:hypothetical protein AMTRI_Chr08g206710 [Amborella trichopoda]
MVRKRKQPFDSLPDEMVEQIMANSRSFDMLSVLGRSCKRFKGLSHDPLILQRVSREIVAESLWQEKKNKPTSCLKQSADAGNLKLNTSWERSKKKDEGVEYLKNAIKLGHPKSIYGFGLIVMSEGKFLEDIEFIERIEHLISVEVNHKLLLISEKCKNEKGQSLRLMGWNQIEYSHKCCSSKCKCTRDVKQCCY